MYDPSKPSSSTLPNIPSQIVSINSFINEQDESKREKEVVAEEEAQEMSLMYKTQRKLRKDIKKMFVGHKDVCCCCS
jgi:hypothetical protein